MNGNSLLENMCSTYLSRASIWIWRACGRLQAKTTIGNKTSIFCIQKIKYITLSVKTEQKFTGNGDTDATGGVIVLPAGNI
jgi:hypothetical protein